MILYDFILSYSSVFWTILFYAILFHFMSAHIILYHCSLLIPIEGEIRSSDNVYE